MSTTTTLADTLPQEVQNILHLNKKPEPEPSKINNHTKPGLPGPDYPYAHLLPSYDQGYKLEQLKPFEHVDPGHAALKDPNPQSFLDGAQVTHLAPKFGSDISGVQLTSLGEREKRSVWRQGWKRVDTDEPQSARSLRRSTRSRRFQGPRLYRSIARMATRELGKVSQLLTPECSCSPSADQQDIRSTSYTPDVRSAERIPCIPPCLPRRQLGKQARV